MRRTSVFTLAAAQAAGVATVRVTAAAKGTEAFASTELAVRPINPMISSSKELAIAAGASAAFTIPELGLPGTRRASIRISPMPGITFGHRLEYLIRYPYGCMEQTMSAVFPQLYLKHIFEPADVESESRRIDANIDAGIQRLQRFRTPDGGFGYWPGATTTDEWATNYGGHYLLEASRLGYHVPSDLMDGWMAFQRRMAARESGNSATRSYRLFLLALAGEPMVGAMNLLAEEKLDEMNNLSKWLLASGYKLAGMDEAAHRILAAATTEVKPYRELGGTFGSATRDHAMMLYLATKLDRPEVALDLYHELAPILGGRGYLSTHSAGYALLAVGNYLDWTWRADAEVRGRLTVAGKGGLDRKFARSGGAVTIDLDRAHRARDHHRLLERDSHLRRLRVAGDSRAGAHRARGAQPQPRCPLARRGRRPHRPLAAAPGHPLLGPFPGRLEIRQAARKPRSDPDRPLRLGDRRHPAAGRAGTRLGAQVHPRQRHLHRYPRRPGDVVLRSRPLSPLDFLVKLMVVTRGEFVLAPTLVEAMYDDDFRALVPGGRVEVVAAEEP